MSEDTKLCPYCAEEIKAAAIVCKHCGRELPGFESQVQELDKSVKVEKTLPEPGELKTPFRVANGYAIVITILGLIGMVVNNYNQVTGRFSTDLIPNLIFGGVFGYLFFLLIIALIVWVKRKIGLWGLFGVIVSIIALIYTIIYLYSENYLSLSRKEDSQRASTATPKPTNTTVVRITYVPCSEFEVGQWFDKSTRNISQMDNSFQSIVNSYWFQVGLDVPSCLAQLQSYTLEYYFGLAEEAYNAPGSIPNNTVDKEMAMLFLSLFRYIPNTDAKSINDIPPPAAFHSLIVNEVNRLFINYGWNYQFP